MSEATPYAFGSQKSEIDPTKYLHPYPQLVVEDVTESDARCDEIAAVINSWQEIAINEKMVADAHFSEIFSTLEEITDHMKMCIEIRQKWHKKQWVATSPNIRIFSCRDKLFHEVQAIAFAKLSKEDSTLELDLLATNPHNVRAPSNANAKNKVRGAGSAIIHHLATHTLTTCRKITLEASMSAVSFYENLGFEKTENRGRVFMSLSQEKIEQVAKKTFGEKNNSKCTLL